MPEDYDGDGRTDIGVFRGSSARWYFVRSLAGYQEVAFGANGDIPTPADFDGDGKANYALFRPSTGYWYTSLDPAINYGAVQLGLNGDVPVPGYYDGDGKVDHSVFRSGAWYIRQSIGGGLRSYSFGTAGDIAIPTAP